MPSSEEQLQPHMESSTEAMDTNEGQRTTARLLEEARHLLESTMEPIYATIDEPTTAMTGGSEAGLPAGSFSPFDFDKDFYAGHRVRPEDVTNLATVAIHQGNLPSCHNLQKSLLLHHLQGVWK